MRLLTHIITYMFIYTYLYSFTQVLHATYLMTFCCCNIANVPIARLIKDFLFNNLQGKK